MSRKEDLRLVHNVSEALQRVMADLSSLPRSIADQVDPDKANPERFRATAWGHAETLEREAKNLRDAVARHFEAEQIETQQPREGS